MILAAHGSGKNEGEHWEEEGAIRFEKISRCRVLLIVGEERIHSLHGGEEEEEEEGHGG